MCVNIYVFVFKHLKVSYIHHDPSPLNTSAFPKNRDVLLHKCDTFITAKKIHIYAKILFNIQSSNFLHCSKKLLQLFFNRDQIKVLALQVKIIFL